MSSEQDSQEKKEPKGIKTSGPEAYSIYIILTIALFLGLALIAWLAHDQGWAPNRSL